jgi:hypothetical protein
MSPLFRDVTPKSVVLALLPSAFLIVSLDPRCESRFAASVTLRSKPHHPSGPLKLSAREIAAAVVVMVEVSVAESAMWLALMPALVPSPSPSMKALTFVATLFFDIDSRAAQGEATAGTYPNGGGTSADSRSDGFSSGSRLSQIARGVDAGILDVSLHVRARISTHAATTFVEADVVLRDGDSDGPRLPPTFPKDTPNETAAIVAAIVEVLVEVKITFRPTGGEC